MMFITKLKLFTQLTRRGNTVVDHLPRLRVHVQLLPLLPEERKWQSISVTCFTRTLFFFRLLQLAFEEVALHAGQEVLMEVDHNRVAIVDDPKGILDLKLRSSPTCLVLVTY
jgi:hypothetical protein